MDEWYKVTEKEITSKGGRQLLYHYNDSIIHLLRNVYPEFSWKPWMFSRLPRNIFEGKPLKCPLLR